jgi:hypothetical protein
MKTKISILLLLISATVFGQFNYEFGYWETNFWKKSYRKAGKKDGDQIIKYKDGKPRYEVSFKDGFPSGTWKFYDKDGKLLIESQYKGEFKRYNTYDGELTELGEYTNGVISGTWKYWDEDNCADVEGDLEYVQTSEFHVESKKKIKYPKSCKEKKTPKEKTGVPVYYFRKHRNPVGFSLQYEFGKIDMTFTNPKQFAFQDIEAETFNHPGSDYKKFSFQIINDKRIAFNMGLALYQSSVLELEGLEIYSKGTTFNINTGYSISLKNIVHVIPTAGVGFGRNELFLKNDNAIAADSVSLRYTTGPIIFNYGCEARVNIPFSGFKNRGVYVGVKYGVRELINKHHYVVNMATTRDSENPALNQSHRFNMLLFTVGMYTFK